MQKTAIEIQPNLLRLALGIPAAGVGGLFGYMTTPKEHRFEGMARGAGIGYMAGTGAGIGTMLGDAVGDEKRNIPHMLAGGLAGGLVGGGVGKMMQGTPQWEQRKKFREELLTVLHEENNKLRRELKGHSPVELLQKMSESGPALTEFASEHPEMATIPIAGGMGAALAEKKKRPALDALRGALVGAGTGAGALAGGLGGRQLAPADPGTGTVSGGILGGLLAYLAAQKLLGGIGREKVALGPALQSLIEAKQLSDKKDYSGKHQRLRNLIEKYPDDFFIDSINGEIAGITHRPTGFKIHAPMKVLPVKLRGFTDVEARVA
jgi:hypothetical protein